jgi:hypothetical protein
MKNSFGCAANRKSQRLISTPTYITQATPSHKIKKNKKKKRKDIIKKGNELTISHPPVNIKGLKKTGNNRNISIATFYKTENNHYQIYESWTLK